MIYIGREDFNAFCAGYPPLEFVKGIQGQVYRNKEGRKTIRFEIAGKGYFIKIHSGIGWREIFKNLLQLKLPVLGASNEWESIKKLEALQIDTLTPVAFGKSGLNPARQFSFIVTEELQDTISLANYLEAWQDHPPEFLVKRRLIKKIAAIAKAIHRDGLSHKDFYLCHFLLQENETPGNQFDPIYLVDLHRMQRRKINAKRWIIKDIGGLYFSAMKLPFTRNDYFYFVQQYTGISVRESFSQNKDFWRKVEKKARRLYRRDWGEEAPRLRLSIQ